MITVVPSCLAWHAPKSWQVDTSRGAEFSCPKEGPETLTRIREQIEPQGLLGVNGSRRDTWPSGMCRGTGGFLVYLLRPGLRPTGVDRIQTFQPAPRETPATVAEQIAFEEQWSQSL